MREFEWTGLYRDVLRHPAVRKVAPRFAVQMPVEYHAGRVDALRLDVSLGRYPSKQTACPQDIFASIKFKRASVFSDEMMDAPDCFHAGGGAVAHTWSEGKKDKYCVQVSKMPDMDVRLLQPLYLGPVHVVDSGSISFALDTPFQLRSNGNRHISVGWSEYFYLVEGTLSTGVNTPRPVPLVTQLVVIAHAQRQRKDVAIPNTCHGPVYRPMTFRGDPRMSVTVHTQRSPTFLPPPLSHSPDTHPTTPLLGWADLHRPSSDIRLTSLGRPTWSAALVDLSTLRHLSVNLLARQSADRSGPGT
ncbi:hypothetical protein CC85DRAFT_138835 [Cutaneotrichosporon oleaginosum]|uniref:Uncharacterized protein n=1 Tax=Cutaneotrichosporon oleaginosum TaxID=879819 RepID=A0A0J0XID3_9TREE|nr:uncharacterized protein CC85DRAFT_138835 [Cutaneotrichosporon oleaginosum]KLT40843.1 hypothetical protein CC85DRAFT_138835 [Cutaneotrichosporon oleaginosum]TXT09297.1 hypothetical protein COLE_03231 [Cutaneotrichosporon oleaginosum]